MRRLLVIPLLAASVLGGACDALGDDVAATADGVDIPIADVTALAADPAWNPGGEPVDDVSVAGEPARAALGTLVQFALAHAELERRGGEVTDADRQAVEANFGQNPQFQALSPAAREVFVEGTAVQIALDARLREIDPADPAEQRALWEQTSTNHEQRCVAGFVTPAGEGGAVLDALRAGEAPEAVLEAGTGSAQPAFGAELVSCFSESQLAGGGVPEDVVDLVFGTGVGESASITTVAQAGELDVIVAVVEDRVLEPEGDDIAGLVAQVAQGGVQAWLPLVLPDAEVQVDPRFGEGVDPATGSITPPPSPAPSLPDLLEAG